MITSREDPADRWMFHDPATVTQGYMGTWRIPAENITTMPGCQADRRLPSGIPSGGRR